MQEIAATDPESVLSFWFGEIDETTGVEPSLRAKWMTSDPTFDQLIGDRFGKVLDAAARGELDRWEATARGRLALIIVLDQFSRNVLRGTEAMFASDHKALGLSARGIERGDDQSLACEERMFFYMPFMHSENLEEQRRCVGLFKALVDSAGAKLRPRIEEALRYAEQHREIVERFGRFPHRNATLERTSTGEEVAFLRGPSSSF